MGNIDIVDDLTPMISEWPVRTASLGIADASQVLGVGGDPDRILQIASVSKLFTSYAALIAVEEGTLDLDAAAGPDGSTVRHLLAHASGLGFDDTNQHFAPGARRIYSNTGIEQLARELEQASGLAFNTYVTEAVIEPLSLTGFVVAGSPAHGMSASVHHLLRFGQELLTPTLVAASTLAEATSPVFGDLRGVLPGFGIADPNPWGLGFEIRGTKDPHWTSPQHGPTTFGHFGGSGSFLWVDPERRLVGASVADRPFGDWAAEAWPVANTALLEAYG